MGTPNRQPYPRPQPLPQHPSDASLPAISTTSYETIDHTLASSRRQPRRAAAAATASAKYTSDIHKPQQEPRPDGAQDLSSARSDRSSAMDTSDHRSSLRRRSSSPSVDDSDEGGVKYTKTGRVSKALKGKRVHRCELCHKSYTRAEHLRRHQLNHGGEMLPCDVVGCTRSFVREDLLLRHKEEQHEQNQEISSSRASGSAPRSNDSSARGRVASRPAIGSSSSSSGTAPKRQIKRPTDLQQAQDSTNSSIAAEVAPEYHFTTTPTTDPNLRNYQPIQTESTYPWIYPQSSYSTWSTRSFDTSPGLYESPAPESFDPHNGYAHHLSHAAPYPYLSPTALQSHDFMQVHHMELSRSKSPASTSSGAFAATTWHSSIDDFSIMPELASSNTSDGSLYAFASQPDSYLSGAPIPHSLAGIGPDRGNVVASFANMDASEKQQIDQVFLNQSPLFHSGQYELEAMQRKYFASYWANFHPLYPILHRASFEVSQAPPLLTAFMMVIGASFLDESARAHSRSLREVCNKLLKQRPDASYLVYRLQDLHTTLLAEAFSLYKSRRPSTSCSAQFERLYAELQLDNDIFSSMARPGATTLISSGLPPDLEEEVAQEIRTRWCHSESKRRLFLACFVLETQHKVFFGQTRHIFDEDVPFPCTNELWEASSLNEWYELARVEPLPQYVFSDVMTDIQKLDTTTTFDSFRSAIVISCLSRNQDTLLHPLAQQLVSCLERRPRTQLNYHAAMVAMHTPVRALLSVGGESFVLGEKLATRGQYVQAEMDLGKWASSEDAKLAIQHALQVLRIAFEHGFCRMLQEDFALYLSTLVCWACTIWTRRRMAPSPNEQQEDVTGLTARDQMAAFLKSSDEMADQYESSVAPLDWKRALGCLVWTKESVQSRLMGGISEDAVNVLSKLLEARPVSSGGTGGPNMDPL